jgi:hypothetical protein
LENRGVKKSCGGWEENLSIQTSPTSLHVHVSKLAFAETLTHHFHCTVLKVANTNNTPHLQFFSNSKFKSTSWHLSPPYLLRGTKTYLLLFNRVAGNI